MFYWKSNWNNIWERKWIKDLIIKNIQGKLTRIITTSEADDEQKYSYKCLNIEEIFEVLTNLNNNEFMKTTINNGIPYKNHNNEQILMI